MTGWNGSDRRLRDGAAHQAPPPRAPSRRPLILRLACAGGVIVAAVIAFLMFSTSSDPVAEERPVSKGRANSAGAAGASGRNRKSVPDAVRGGLPANGPDRAAEEAIPGGRTSSGSSAASNETAKAVDPRLEAFKREPVRGGAAQLLSTLFPEVKGEQVPPMPLGAEPVEGGVDDLEKAGEKLLTERGQVEEWDTEHSIAFKERFELMREEWRAAHDRGVSFRDFLKNRQKDIEADHEHLQQAKKLDAETHDDATLTDQQYLDAHEKINRVLEMQGFEKLKTPEEIADEDAAEEAQADSSK